MKVSKPSVSLEEALQSLAPKGGTGKPSKHSLPGFHNNVFVRMLAAKPKMDIRTSRHYPSTILNKIGVTADAKIGAVSREAVFSGPRKWVSAWPEYTTVPVSSQHFLGKYPLPIPRLNLEERYRAREVLLKEIEDMLSRYLAEPPQEDTVVCTVSEAPDTLAPFNIDISEFPDLKQLIPAKIDARKHGLHLAGYVYKYTFVYRKRRK